MRPEFREHNYVDIILVEIFLCVNYYHRAHSLSIYSLRANNQFALFYVESWAKIFEEQNAKQK